MPERLISKTIFFSCVMDMNSTPKGVPFICPLSRAASLALSGSEQGVDGVEDAGAVGFGAEAVDEDGHVVGCHLPTWAGG